VSITCAEIRHKILCRLPEKVEKYCVILMEADPRQELMVVRYSGNVTPAEAVQGLPDATDVLAQLEKGFRLLVDMTELQRMDVACAPYIEKVMDLCQLKGVTDIVRVIPDPRRDIGMQIMSQFHYDSSVHLVTCETLLQAREILAIGDGVES
jgi:anti-anti-sigma regulatory factor